MRVSTIYRAQALAGAILIAAGSAKIAGMSVMVRSFEAIGLGQSLRIGAGFAEIVGGLCLLLPSAGAVGAGLVFCVIAGMLAATVGYVASTSASSNEARWLSVHESGQGPSAGIGNGPIEFFTDRKSRPGWHI